MRFHETAQVFIDSWGKARLDQLICKVTTRTARAGQA